MKVRKSFARINKHNKKKERKKTVTSIVMYKVNYLFNQRLEFQRLLQIE